MNLSENQSNDGIPNMRFSGAKTTRKNKEFTMMNIDKNENIVNPFESPNGINEDDKYSQLNIPDQSETELSVNQD